MDLRKKIKDGDYDVPPGVYGSQGREEYRRQAHDLMVKFKDDLLKHLDITGHPKAERLWEMAWEEGHSAGYEEVLSSAETLVDLLDEVEWVPVWPTKIGGYWFHGKRFGGDDVEVRFHWGEDITIRMQVPKMKAVTYVEDGLAFNSEQKKADDGKDQSDDDPTFPYRLYYEGRIVPM